MEICGQLKMAGIPFGKSERLNSVFPLETIEWLPRFEIVVPQSQYSRATQATGLGHRLGDDEGEVQAVMELPEMEAAGEQPTDAGSGELEPEVATVEVWSGVSEECAAMIEASYIENDIYFRREELENGAMKLFVPEEDENRAREIVREIVEAAPPE